MKNTRKKRDILITGKFAYTYDADTKKNRMDEMNSYVQLIENYVKEGDAILEVASGPGLLSIALAKKQKYKVSGIELSEDFVKIAKANASEESVSVNFSQGNASALPEQDSTFNFIICTAAFKNFKEPIKVLNEMYRVLKPDGTALVIDMDKNICKEDLNKMTKRMNKKGLTALFYKFIFKSLKKSAYTKEEIEAMINRTEFKNFHVDQNEGSLHIYMIKEK